MIAEPVARRPVGDVRIDPALEDGKILALIPARKGVSPLRNDERLLHVSRPVEFLTESKDLRLWAVLNLLPVSLCHCSHGGGLHAVTPNLFLEESL